MFGQARGGPRGLMVCRGPRPKGFQPKKRKGRADPGACWVLSGADERDEEQRPASHDTRRTWHGLCSISYARCGCGTWSGKHLGNDMYVEVGAGQILAAYLDQQYPGQKVVADRQPLLAGI